MTEEIREELAAILAAMIAGVTAYGMPAPAAIAIAIEEIKQLLEGGQ